ncbi:MAG: hypothetical protein ACE5DW_02125 [Thermodesulfobacteriota bacterium]
MPVVTVTILPDATTVAHGSVPGYQVTATNTTAVQQCFQYWENVTPSEWSHFPGYGEFFGPLRLCLAGKA